MPYSVISTADAEITFQIINQIGITPYAKVNLVVQGDANCSGLSL